MAIFHLPFSIFHLFHLFRFFSARIFQLIMPHIVASCVELSNSRQPCPVLWSGTRRTALSPTPTSDGKRPSSSCEILAKFSWNSFENYSYFPGGFSFSVFPKMKIFCSLTKKRGDTKKSREKICADIQCECGRGPPRRRQTILTAKERDRDRERKIKEWASGWNNFWENMPKVQTSIIFKIYGNFAWLSLYNSGTLAKGTLAQLRKKHERKEGRKLNLFWPKIWPILKKKFWYRYWNLV